MKSENQEKAKKIIECVLNSSEDTATATKEVVKLIEKIRLEERSASCALITSIRSVYVRNLLPMWEEIGYSDRLAGILEIEKKFKAFRDKSQERLTEYLEEK